MAGVVVHLPPSASLTRAMSVMTVGWVESAPVMDQIVSDFLPPSCTIPAWVGRPPDEVGLGEV